MHRLLLIILLFGIVLFQFPRGQGSIHSDTSKQAAFYMQVAVEFSEVIENESYNVLELTQVLPFALLNLIYKFLGLRLQTSALTSGMLILNFLFLVLGVHWFFRIIRHFDFGTTLEVLLFVLTFFNFFVLKTVWNQPFTNDLAAFAWSLGLMHFFISDQKQKLLLLTLTGTFISPILPLIGLCLMVFPEERLVLKEGPKRPGFLFASLSILFFVFLIWMIWLTERFSSDLSGIMGMLMSIGVLLLGFYQLAKRWPIDWTKSLVSKRINRPLKSMAIFFLGIGGTLILLLLLSGDNSQVSLKGLAQGYGKGVLSFPFDFLIHHTLFYGLMVPLTLIFARKVLRAAALTGFGTTVLMGFMLFFAIYPDPKMLVPFLGPLVFVLMRAVSSYKVKWKDIWKISLLNLILTLFGWLLQPFVHGDSLSGQPVTQFLSRYDLLFFSAYQDVLMMALLLSVFILLLFLLDKGKKRYIRSTGQGM